MTDRFDLSQLLTRDGEASTDLTLDEIQTRRAEIRDELLPLAEAETLDTDQTTQFRSLSEEWGLLDTAETAALAARADIQERQAAQAAALNDWKPRPGNISSPTDGFVAPTGVAQTSTSDPWDRDVLQRTTSPDELQARAIDAAALTTDSTDTRRGALTRMIEEHGDAGMASLVLRTTSADYKSGFGELLRNGGNLALLAPEQRQALEFAEPLAQLQRAQATTSDGAGGYLIPTDIEPSVTLTSDGTDNPIWGMARRVQTAASTLRNVGMPNAAWSWDTEGAEVSDDTVTFTATDIPLYSANGFVPVTIEAQRSIAGIMGDVQRALAGGYQDLVGAALATGSGSAQPTGIITALIGSAAEVETAGSGVYALADVYSWINGLAARHRRNSTAMMAFPIISLTRQFDTAGGAALIARLGDGSPDRIMGLPLVENQDMDSTVSAGTEIAVAGNFDHYVVAEGIGTLVEVIPHLMGANQRPIGARGVYAKTRIGADSVLDTAFSLLQVKA